MKLQIDPDTLTLEQARELARHWCELTEAMTIANNQLISSLNAIFAGDQVEEPRLALQAASVVFNSWSEFLNGASEASNAEVRRILEIEVT